MIGNELYPQRHLRYGVGLGRWFYATPLRLCVCSGIGIPLSITIKS